MRPELDERLHAERSTAGSPEPNVDVGANGAPARRATATSGGHARGGRGRAVLRGAAYGAVLAATIGAVYFATRERKAAATAASPQASGDAAPSANAARAVSLNPSEAQRIGVTYAVATLGAFGKEVRTVGQVTFDETKVRTIAPKIDGFVDRLIVNATGQRVGEGDALFTIYSPMLVTAQEELLLAKRLQQDVAGAGADARRGADELLASSRRRLAYLDIPESEIADIEQTGQVHKTLTVRSSAGGYVLEKNVLAGQKIMAGDALYKVADLRTVWIEGEVFEQDVAAVRLGQRVRAEFDALPGAPRAGQISYIYPTLNPETRTVRIRVVMPNADGGLKPGMYATIRITGTERANVLTVPRSAVLSTGERNIVFVQEASGQLAPHEVTLGASNDDRIEVLRGLAAGETVVASATFLIDAESNLGTALGGMGNMPGMDMTTPPKPLPKKKE